MQNKNDVTTRNEPISPSLIAHEPASPSQAELSHESSFVKWTCVTITFVFIALILILPLIAIFREALSAGVAVFFGSFKDPDTLASIKLTLLAAGISVPLNTIFGLVAAWAIAKFEFKGKSVLISLIDLPFAISPVISGLIYVLIFGAQGWFGTRTHVGMWMRVHHVKVLFAVPGIVLATIFVTFPFVARELIPLMQEQGSEEEQAALSLGAGSFTTFWKVTLPNIRWALLYGVILCNARAMGEFGAVSVVSGHIKGLTNTMPLHIEILYNDNKNAAAFAVATLLALLAIVTLIVKTFAEWKREQQK